MALTERLEALDRMHQAPAPSSRRRSRVQGNADRALAQEEQQTTSVARINRGEIETSGNWRNFPTASQPDLVLANQKDALYRRELRQSLSSAAEATLGPFTLVAIQPELKLLADLFYLGLTTVRGQQTLGEEFVDIFQVAPIDEGGVAFDGGPRLAPPALWRRALVVLLAAVAPYISKRVQSGGWKPLQALFQPAQSARERAASLRRQMLARQQRAAISNIGALRFEGDESLAEKPSYFFLIMSVLKNWGPWLLGWSSLVYRWHLVLFYFKGEYYDVSKRLAGLRYAFTREPQQSRPSYSILGWFLLTQLLVESAPALRHASQNLRGAWASLVGHAPDKATTIQVDSSGDFAEQRVELVASLADDDNGVVFRDDRHARGLEDIKCGICLSAVVNAACPPCGHLFCFEHIMEAIAVKPECPLCRMQSKHCNVQCVYFQL
jgi:peroxin-10